jgi:hypothetical protein
MGLDFEGRPIGIHWVCHQRKGLTMIETDIQEGPAAAAAGAGFALNAETARDIDFMILLDASGSMASASNRYAGKTRWNEAQETIFGISAALAQYDADGIDIVVFGASVELIEGVTPDQVQNVFNTRSPMGTTPLDQALAKVVEKRVRTGKNTVAIVFTDGAPNDRDAVERIIVNAANGLDRDEQLTFLFVQIGADATAAAFLQYLDDELQAKGAKFDIVDTIPVDEAETMQPLDLIAKAIND